MHFPTDNTSHTTAFDGPVVNHWLEWKIAPTSQVDTLPPELHPAPITTEKQTVVLWPKFSVVSMLENDKFDSSKILPGTYLFCWFVDSFVAPLVEWIGSSPDADKPMT